MKVDVITPHGFCMGVERALAQAASLKPPVFCLHELVHNAQVIEELCAKGMRFVESLDEVPDGATVLFSAHGVAPSVRERAAQKGLRVVDATCPFVARAHAAVRDFAARGVPVVIIGHASHVEVRGLIGEAVDFEVVATVEDVAKIKFPIDAPLGVVCQTTVPSDAVLVALKARYPRLEVPAAATTCTATRDRQKAVMDFVRSGGDGVLVLGSATSSNTNRLVEAALAAGASFAVRAGNEAELRALDFSGVRRLGVTSGASTPESFLRHALSVLY